jgi:hypothetical protein
VVAIAIELPFFPVFRGRRRWEKFLVIEIFFLKLPETTVRVFSISPADDTPGLTNLHLCLLGVAARTKRPKIIEIILAAMPLRHKVIELAQKTATSSRLYKPKVLATFAALATKGLYKVIPLPVVDGRWHRPHQDVKTAFELWGRRHPSSLLFTC